MEHYKSVMCECCGAHLCGLTQKEGWNIPGRALAWHSFVWFCSSRGWAISVLVKAQRWVVDVHSSSPGTTWGKTGSSEEKPLPHPVGTGMWQANPGRARGVWFAKGPSNLLLSPLSFPPSPSEEKWEVCRTLSVPGSNTLFGVSLVVAHFRNGPRKIWLLQSQCRSEGTESFLWLVLRSACTCNGKELKLNQILFRFYNVRDTQLQCLCCACKNYTGILKKK